MSIIPRCMSTQHPDNATVPFFATASVLAGEDEVREAYYAYSHLGCDEQMWDVEGKEIDVYVVKKLLSFYPEYFQDHVLGQDVRLTLRVPNPLVEKAEAKILLETLESIPRSYDVASLFYKDRVAPIFEVILPMTVSARCIDRVYRYYMNHIVGRQHLRLRDDDITIAEWIGEFSPPSIGVIPLFEDVPTLLRSADIMREYLADKPIREQRVFLARSDTAMNYGLVAAALANKIALARLDELSASIGVRFYPIIGLGAAPFRGGLSPPTVERVGKEYPSVVTFTIQSAFKYDYPVPEVRAACEYLRTREIGQAMPVDTERALAIIERYSLAYRQQIAELAPYINHVAQYVPPRRTRKLHVGLFGYAREMNGITLPRAISFVCALYSLGLPPELIAFDALTADDLAFLDEVYPSFRAEIRAALGFTDLEGPFMTRSLRTALEQAGFSFSPHPEHLELVRRIRRSLEQNHVMQLTDLITRAAILRRFLG
ncbi:MAG: phosphoenolpyruvate carboxylase [Anaerolineae bacterium]|nr:phosphoenolpyruvate carboxylase [Anaerolineae bacterium]MDW8067810.1 phosphoenolpyruvate carboxylase [Anaerolineae bacterium]